MLYGQHGFYPDYDSVLMLFFASVVLDINKQLVNSICDAVRGRSAFISLLLG